MVLLDEVVEVFVLAHEYVNIGVSLDTFNAGDIGAAFVDGDFLWHIVQADGSLKKTPGCCLIPLSSK